VALHTYTDENGEILYWKMRCKHPETLEKWVRPIHENGNGFEMGEPKFQNGKPLYALHRIANNHDAIVWITEGEQKSDALNKLGLVATTSGGATSAETTDWKPLRGRNIKIFPDNDEAGKSYAETVARILLSMGCTVSCVDVDKLGLGTGDDVMEWLEAHPGASAADIEALPILEKVNTDSESWPSPQPLTVKTKPEPYPTDALPETIRQAITEVASFVKAPLPMVASSALSALSLVGQALVDVQRDEILVGPAGLFMLTIADSGERKTQADKMFTKPIQDYQDEKAEAGKIKWADYKATLEAWEAKRGGIKDKIRQLAKGDQSTTDLETRLRELENEKPEPPRIPKLMREDATPEGLAKKLQNEWPSAGVVSNEAGIVFGSHGMSKESVMRNLALLNKLWDGGRYQSDRSDEERSRDVKGARLTMALMIQEATLRTFFDQTRGLARGCGFLSRFLVAWPESTMGTRRYSPPTKGSPALSKFNRRITALLNQDVPMDNGILTPPILALTEDAKAAWIDFHDAIEIQLSDGGDWREIRDIASKAADNAVRLAALFQLFEGSTSAVGIDAFESASLIVAWHLNEARRFFGELALPVELADAARLDSWLIEHCKREKTHLVGKNHTRRNGPLRNTTALEHAIHELTDLDRIQLVKEEKTQTIKVNPALLLNEGI